MIWRSNFQWNPFCNELFKALKVSLHCTSISYAPNQNRFCADDDDDDDDSFRSQLCLLRAAAQNDEYSRVDFDDGDRFIGL